MALDSVFFKDDVCFKKEWSGFDTIRPLNVLIGRNNSGKSRLVDFVEALCNGKFEHRRARCRLRCEPIQV